MRILIVILFFISLGFMSCDGRDRAYKTNQDVLKEHNLYKSFSESVSFVPENYMETTNDTILSNGFQVKIKSFTDMKRSVLKEFTKNNIAHKTYYRNIKATISILKDNRKIISTTIDKDIFKNFNNSSKTDSNPIIQGIWLNQYASIINDKVILNVRLYEPETKNHEDYTLSFDENGTLSIDNKETLEYS